jgi:hypothetical protein
MARTLAALIIDDFCAKAPANNASDGHTVYGIVSRVVSKP